MGDSGTPLGLGSGPKPSRLGSPPPDAYQADSITFRPLGPDSVRKSWPQNPGLGTPLDGEFLRRWSQGDRGEWGETDVLGYRSLGKLGGELGRLPTIEHCEAS